ncbi:lytic transglycosylase domain-containing protein [Desulfotalea psychrophila]|uniref:Probable lytic transglycosylase n=1 Tax=Desulfotalea psychrophila (strain LSv54 / DSM 12343) TaxID=177439 RepID=Q6ANX7_DESPS|nr:lytic transglycosylase domain-containing protein [Desulfotalea psychrophila]CAG35947.1 probable lytic transglycosylase [Desulfotalea psychrophila LSv54]
MKIKLIFTICFAIFVWTVLFQGEGKARQTIQKLDYNCAWQNYQKRAIKLSPAKSFPYQICFEKAAKRYDIPVTLLLSIAKGESDFNPRAKSSAACYGIMQIHWPGTAKDLGFTSLAQLYDPCRNIMAGARYIRMMLDRYRGNIHLALAAYNYGPGRIKQKSRNIPEGANWYSGYIYHHLKTVLDISGRGIISEQYMVAQAGKRLPKPRRRPKYIAKHKIPVLLFHDPFLAEKFIDYFYTRAPEVQLDWFRNRLGESFVVLLFNTEEEKKSSLAKMAKLGYYLDPNKKFM